MLFNKIFFTVNEYDYSDFASVVPIASSPYVLSVSNKSGITNMKEFIEATKTRKLNCGISNSAGNLNLKYIIKKLDLPNVEIVPFKGAGDVLLNVMSGNLDCSFDPWSVVAQNFKEGKINVIALARDERYTEHPNVPLLKEYIKDFVVTGWFGIAVTKNSKFAQRDQIIQLANQVYKDKGFVSNIKLLHYDVVKPPANPEKWLDAEYQKYEEQRRLIGIEKTQP
jgi:tripartite-type tricarboxylate transporter receptor subunit TctC